MKSSDFSKAISRVKSGPDDCWIWDGPKNAKGYGVARCYGLASAHRVSYRIHKGPIPPGLCVCHSCDNPPCVNPKHLWLGTKGDNNRDRETKNRGNHATGDRNGSRTHPERRQRGMDSYFHKRPELYSVGEANNKAKLTELDVIKMRKLRNDSGLPYSVIASKFGVTKAAARFAITGITWRHIK